MQRQDKRVYKVHNEYMWVRLRSLEVHPKLMHQQDIMQYKPHNQNNVFHQRQTVCLVCEPRVVEETLHFQ